MRKVISIGKVSSAITTAVAVVYAMLLVLYRLHLIPHPANLYSLFLPSLLLTPAFLITTVCIDIVADKRSRKWTIAAWALATINCTMMMMLYGAAPGVFAPSHLNWETPGLVMIGCEHPFELMAMRYAVFLLSSASSLLLAFGFRNVSAGWFDRRLLINALLLPFFILSCIFPHFYYFLISAWLITFALATIEARNFFMIKERKLQKEENRNTSVIQWIIQ